MAIRETALGSEHQEVFASLNKLAVLYHALGRYAEAKPLYQRSLEIGEKALGPDHPLVADILYQIAALSHAQGKAMEYRGQAAAIKEIYRGIVLMALPPAPEVKYAINIIDEREGLTNIRKALDILLSKSPFSAAKVESLKKNGLVIIIYDSRFPYKSASSLGTLVASFRPVVPLLLDKHGEASGKKSFLVVVGRYGAKWPPKELAYILAHELVGHGIQHLRGRLEFLRESDRECEASLYEDAVQWDLGINKKSTDMVAFRQKNVERNCSNFKKYMAKNTPSLLKLWDVLRLDVPKILAVFEDYVRTQRDLGPTASTVKKPE